MLQTDVHSKIDSLSFCFINGSSFMTHSGLIPPKSPRQLRMYEISPFPLSNIILLNIGMILGTNDVIICGCLLIIPLMTFHTRLNNSLS